MVSVREYIEDFDDVADAHAAYIADLTQAAAGGDGPASIGLRLVQSATSKIECLDRALTGRRPRFMALDWSPKAHVFVGTVGARFSTERRGEEVAILLDQNLLFRVALYVALVGWNRDDDVVAEGLSAFLLMSIIVPRDEAFPSLQALLEVTARENSATMNDIVDVVLSFILFHELGHSYVEAHGSGFVQMRFSTGGEFDPAHIRSVRYHPDGTIYNNVPLAGSANGLLVVDARFSTWAPEFASDVFALYATLLASNSTLAWRHRLDWVTSCLDCWQLLLFALGRRQDYMRAISEEAPSAEFSHPAAHARVDLMIHHLNALAEEFEPEWESEALTLLRNHYMALWDKRLRSLLDDATEYVRYGFDGSGPNLNVGQVWSFAKNLPVPHVPTAYEKLQAHFLEPFLAGAEARGWDGAVSADAAEHRVYLETFRLNDQPIVIMLGKALHDLGIRFISEPRQ
jgi:hypothetical protein